MRELGARWCFKRAQWSLRCLQYTSPQWQLAIGVKEQHKFKRNRD